MWQSGDPIDRFNAQSSTIGLNLYQYGLQNPVRYTDPQGLDEEDQNKGIVERLAGAFGKWAGKLVVETRGKVQAEREAKIAEAIGEDPEAARQAAYQEAKEIGQEVEKQATETAKPVIEAAGLKGLGKLLGIFGTLGGQANKLKHIFGKSVHKIDDIVKEFGSQENAFQAMQEATQAAVKSKNLTGVFEVTVRVGRQDVVVRGKVIDGVAKIGTAFKP